MLEETNCSLGTPGLFGSKEDLFREMSSLVSSVTIKTEILNQEERIASIQHMVNLGFLIKVDEMPALNSDLMELELLTNIKTKKFDKRGIASTLDEDSTMQPSKGKIYGRRFNGRFASKATFKYHNKRCKNLQIKAKQKHKFPKIAESMIEFGLTWMRVGKTRALKTLEALRVPPAFSLGSKTKKKMKFEELSDMEPKTLHEVPYDYDDLESHPPLPPANMGFTCGMDYCRLGCVCQSISGSQKKLLRRDHCCQYQCMFSCHCQHLTRSRASLFESLSPIMDSKFSFTKLSKTTLPTKKKLFIPNELTNSVDSGDEIRKNESEKGNVASPKKDMDKSTGCVKKSGKVKENIMDNSLTTLESEISKQKIGGKSEDINREVVNKKRPHKKNKPLPKTKSNNISENSQSALKSTPTVDCLEISSDSEDDTPPQKKKKEAALPDSQKGDGFEAPLLHPAGSFYMEHVLVKKTENDGSMKNLLVASYHDFDWQSCKKMLSSVFYENIFTKNGVSRVKKNIEWSNYKILLHPTKEITSVPKYVLDKLGKLNFEYVKAIVTKSSPSSKETIIINSPVKNVDSKECKDYGSQNKHLMTKDVQVKTSKCDDVIVVEDDEMSDTSDCPDIINNVGSLAPIFNDNNKLTHLSNEILKSSPNKIFGITQNINSFGINSPILQVPFSNATGISGCRQFKFNAVQQQPHVVPSTKTAPQVAVAFNKALPLRNSSISNSTLQQKPLEVPQDTNLIKTTVVKKDILSIQPHSNVVKTTENITTQLINLVTTRCSSSSVSTKKPTLLINSGIKLLKMPSVQISSHNNLSTSPLNLSLTKSPTLSNNNEQKKNLIILQPQAKPPHNNETDGKKVIVLKHVPTSLSSRFYSAGNSIQRPIAPKNNIVNLLPRHVPIQIPLRRPILSLNPKPNVISLISKEDISSPILSTRTGENNFSCADSSAIEIRDSDEEENQAKIEGNTNLPLAVSDMLQEDLVSAEAFPGADLKLGSKCETSGLPNDVNGSNFDSESMSSHSEQIASEEHEIYQKRLKDLYHEIEKIEDMQERRNKISAVNVLQLVLKTVKKLQDANLELENEMQFESDTKEILIKKLQEIKDDANANG